MAKLKRIKSKETHNGKAGKASRKAKQKNMSSTTINPDANYFAKDAARLVKVSPRRMRLFCKEGRLGKKDPETGFYRISGAELAAFANEPRPTGMAGFRLLHSDREWRAVKNKLRNSLRQANKGRKAGPGRKNADKHGKRRAEK